ncbi:MAG: iron ABC transporter permease, partial [Gemmatales bacterium]|nr:iron ABC transporter permease [Gemmatales bacterium]MDW8174938.1 iron ABC transporter permease [Gemmatales bacterium]
SWRYWPEWLILGFFAAFLLYPVLYIVPMAARDRHGWTWEYVAAIWHHPLLARALYHSLALGAVTVVGTTLLSWPVAWYVARYRVWGSSWLLGWLLIPLVLPPFVGALGLEQFLHPFGTLNGILSHLGWIDPSRPPDWLARSGFLGVAVMQTLHLYPILLLNLAAALANIDRSLEDAARSLGAGRWRVFRTVTLPLALPGYYAGAVLVFITAFTDLGTPLMFNYASVLPVQVFNLISEREVNPLGYALVLVILVLSGGLFIISRRGILGREYQLAARGASLGEHQSPLPGWGNILIWTYSLILLTVSLVPHGMVLLLALEGRWQFTALPTIYSFEAFRTLSHEGIVVSAVRNSVFYSMCSTGLDLFLGVTLAWLIIRRPSRLGGLLDGLAMLPLALPGIVLAFGYLTCYARLPLGPLRSWLDPGQNPTVLLIISYAVRRLPYVVRSTLAGLQQVPAVLEEAAASLGASRWQVWRSITLPLIRPHLLAGAILAFAFAMLEVSDSLMLAQQEKYYPITRAIYGLSLRPDDGPQLASALGVIGMVLLFAALLIASRALGRSLGELFRA